MQEHNYKYKELYNGKDFNKLPVYRTRRKFLRVNFDC